MQPDAPQMRSFCTIMVFNREFRILAEKTWILIGTYLFLVAAEYGNQRTVMIVSRQTDDCVLGQDQV